MMEVEKLTLYDLHLLQLYLTDPDEFYKIQQEILSQLDNAEWLLL